MLFAIFEPLFWSSCHTQDFDIVWQNTFKSTIKIYRYQFSLKQNRLVLDASRSDHYEAFLCKTVVHGIYKIYLWAVVSVLFFKLNRKLINLI